VIPLEVVFALLDQIRAEALARAENPLNRDATELGTISGMLQACREFRERIDALVEDRNRSDED
jgi:hypothetical protein